MEDKGSITALQVAEWMRDEVLQKTQLPQHIAVDAIRRRFGETFINNRNGSVSIRKDVLDQFKKLTLETVVWNGAWWEPRRPHHKPGRQQ